MKFFNLLLRIALIVILSTSIFADKDNKEEKDENEDEDVLESFIEDLKFYPGLFDAYRDEDDGKIYLLLTKEQLEVEFIYFAQILDGIIEAGTWRGNYLDNGIVKFSKYFDQIRIERINTAYVFDKDSPLANAKNANISNSLIDSLKIEKTSKNKDKFLLDITSLLLSENLSKITTSPYKESSKDSFKIGSISKNKSSIENIFNYPENTDFEINYIFSNASNKPIENQDSRNNSISLRYSFIKYPKNDFKPRIESQRIGFFSERKTNLTSTDITPYEDLINKWHLEKVDKTKDKSPPLKPITFWIENTTPLEIRPIIEKAVLSWNSAFEEAGFLNAIEVKIQQDDAKWNAGDIRYNTIRWTSSPNPPFGGYGPSFTNPRTGEILGADIMLEWVYLTNRIRYSEIFESQDNITHEDFCNHSRFKHENKLFGKIAAEGMDFNIDETNRLFEEDLYQLILHEVGHTLGLNHNFAASNLHNNVDIHDPEITYDLGLSSSVMDYHGLNIAPQGKEQGQFADIKPGKYDVFAIKYAYTPDLTKEELKKLLFENSSSEYLFGNDGDDMRSPGKGIDPRINTGDMSSNPVEYAKDRIILSQSLIPTLYEKLKNKSDSWESIYQGYRILLRQIHTSAEIISRQVAGIYITRGLLEEDITPYEVVPYEIQKKSIKILEEHYFNSKKLVLPADIANKLQRERRSFDFFGMTEDPKIHNMILKGQKKVLKHFTNSKVLKRLTDSSLYGNKYLPNELLEDLTNSIFNNKESRKLNGIDQNLQNYYLKRLILILNSGKFDSPSISASYASLKKIKAYTFSPSNDAATENHKKMISWKIEKVLNPS